MLKKDKEAKLNVESCESLSRTKMAYVESPVLVSPYYQKPFFIFSFASPHTVVVLLLQKNSEGHEKSITFFSQVL